MRKTRAVATGFLIIALLLTANAGLTASGFRQDHMDEATASVRSATASASPLSVPTVTLRAASGETIEFRTQNGEEHDGVPSRSSDLPRLVLTRSGALTLAREPTLHIEVSGIAVPPGGSTLTLTVSTERVDPDADAGSAETIPVWHEARHIAWEGGTSETHTPVVFTRTFTETVFVAGNEVDTPTDYFWYSITVDGHETDGARSVLELHGDFAFLMENQVRTQLPQVREESEGAAPDELVVYYCDMVPFQGGRDSTQLRRSEVSRFVESELGPRMVEAFRAQGDGWGFMWHTAWTSYDPEAGERELPVALTDRGTWYHGRAPLTGHAGISINVAGKGSDHYDSLADAIMSTFHHELFHNLQRSAHQGVGGDGRVDGLNQAWQWFSEGTAELAISVGQPDVEFMQKGRARYHVQNSNRFFLVNLSSRRAMAASAAVVYWRFLYEHCGGMSAGIEDPGAGMGIIRASLAALYSNDTVDIGESSDVIGSIPHLMDQALAGTPSCPFDTYEESLNHFASAVYALTLDQGRCKAPGTPEGCGFYDPQGLYLIAPPQTIQHRGSEYSHSSVIHSSYGMDFIDVVLDPLTDGQPLVIELEGAANGRAAFSVQVWRLVDAELGSRPRPVPEQADGPDVVGTVGPDGRLVYTIPSIDVTQFSRIGLIIVRVDTNEGFDPVGAYAIRLSSAEG